MTARQDERRRAMRRAKRLEWATFGFTLSSVTLTYLVLGNSQALQTAWIEDMLSLIPPLAFLIAVRIGRRPATEEYPYGYHRASAVGHLVAATALFAVGAFLLFDSASVLLAAEHPSIGTVVILGQPIWQGWLMIAAMAYGGSVPAILGRIKLKIAPVIQDKVLYADADMNKADWMTAVAAILGILGIGVGLWWADSVAALVISGSILKDGLTNLRGAVHDLMDARATTVDNAAPSPLISELVAALDSLPWVDGAAVRVRDMGRALHVDAFVVPARGAELSVEAIESARARLVTLDAAVIDVVVMPVSELPEPGVRRSD